MARHWFKVVLAAAALALPAMPAAAQQPLPLAPGEAWKHKHSGISVPATLANTPRNGGTAFAEDELDVGLSFIIGDAQESLTFYIFRNTNGGVPVWFAQAQWSLENRRGIGDPVIALTPQAFTPPGQATASGLKAVYETSGSGFRSTGVALLPVGDWYVKIRASSQTRSPQALAAWMDAAMAEIGWPAAAGDESGAVPVADCSVPLAFPVAAKDVPKTAGLGLAETLGIMLKSEDGMKWLRPAPPATWCRDRSMGDNQQLYRPDDATDRYLIALGDNGRAVLVGSSVAWGLRPPPRDKASDHSIQFVEANETTLYMPQDILPSPERVGEIVNGNHVVASVSTWGANTQIRLTREEE